MECVQTVKVNNGAGWRQGASHGIGVCSVWQREWSGGSGADDAFGRAEDETDAGPGKAERGNVSTEDIQRRRGESLLQRYRPQDNVDQHRRRSLSRKLPIRKQLPGIKHLPK